MFGGDLFSSIFSSNMMLPSSAQLNNCSSHRSTNQCQRNSVTTPGDIFTAFSRAADQFFDAATRSFLRDTEMFSRHLYPSYLRDISEIPANHRRHVGVTLNGEPVITDPSSRFNRHSNHDPVIYERTRLQWYDSNTRRPLLPPPAPPRPEPSGNLSTVEFSKLPISIYHIRSNNASGDNYSSPSASINDSSMDSTNSAAYMVPVIENNSNNIETSPNGAYLKPESRRATLVAIQPIQSSPGRGQPECEVCLTEYQNKDRLRHLPCGHAFHVKCIDVWLKQSTTCPKCRAGVRTGLKRLERARLRSSSVSGPSNAPVRAIGRTSDGRSSSNQRNIGTNASRNQFQRTQPGTSRTTAVSTHRPPSANHTRLNRPNRNRGPGPNSPLDSETRQHAGNSQNSGSEDQSPRDSGDSRQVSQEANPVPDSSNDMFSHNASISSSTPQRNLPTSSRNMSRDRNIATSSSGCSRGIEAQALSARRKAVEAAVKRLAEEQRRSEQSTQQSNQDVGSSS